MLAATVCPNLADHPEVKRDCFQPTASALLSSAIQGGVGKVTAAWRPFTVGRLG